MALVSAGKADEIKLKASKAITISGKSIAVFNQGGTFYAIDATCPHKGGPLSEGAVEDLCVTCPWHGAMFSLETGAGISGPCGDGVRCYPIKDTNGELEIEI